MWYPVSLKINNLFSHEDSYFEFINNKTTTIFGVNKTDLNVESNGSGKTSVLDCITIAFIGEPLRDVAKKDVVRNGEKAGELEFIMNNDVLKEEIKIKWEINASKSNNALLWINGELQKQLKDLEVKETVKFILSKIGISKDDLINYFLISKDSYQSFFLNGDTAKKEIINRFSKANVIDGVDPLIKDDIALMDKKITELKNQNSNNTGVLNHLDEELEKEKIESSIEKTKQLILKGLQENRLTIQTTLDTLPNKIEEKAKEGLEINKKVIILEKDIKQDNDKKEVLDKELKDLEKKLDKNAGDQLLIENKYDDKFIDIANGIKECEKETIEYRTAIKDCDKKIGSLEKDLADKIVCPECEHEFLLRDKTFDLEKANEELAEEKNIKEEIEKLITAAEANIEGLKTSKKNTEFEIEENLKIIKEEKTALKLNISKKETEISEHAKTILAKNRSLNELNSSAKSNQTDLKDLEEKKNKNTEALIKCDQEIKVEQEKKYPSKTTEIQEKINTLTNQNLTLQEEINEWEIDKGSLLEWQLRFKQFKSFLANTSISAIEEMTNFFLEKMRTDLTVTIDGYRELSNKKLKEEITTLVCRSGEIEGELFNKFSGGEKAKVDLACILAMQKIINIAAVGGGLNLLFIDEILESADSLALTSVVKGLTYLDQTILLITHVDHQTLDCNKLKVEKVNKISKIILS